jgi:hypothetical protein
VPSEESKITKSVNVPPISMPIRIIITRV